jgi:aryl-alcohol dehydrogenase-like predicted oxidoreductase
METRTLGALSVSVVGLGCNNFGGRLDQERTTRVVNAALELGINFFDTADVYGGTHSEEFLGRALGARRPAARGVSGVVRSAPGVNGACV